MKLKEFDYQLIRVPSIVIYVSNEPYLFVSMLKRHYVPQVINYLITNDYIEPNARWIQMSKYPPSKAYKITDLEKLDSLKQKN